jgi:hypothetical protein
MMTLKIFSIGQIRGGLSKESSLDTDLCEKTICLVKLWGKNALKEAVRRERKGETGFDEKGRSDDSGTTKYE